MEGVLRTLDNDQCDVDCIADRDDVGFDTLSDCIDDFSAIILITDNAELPQSKEMRVERKRFYFDCGRNNRGSFLRISEVLFCFSLL